MVQKVVSVVSRANLLPALSLKVEIKTWRGSVVSVLKPVQFNSIDIDGGSVQVQFKKTDWLMSNP